jgi:hypothetical protein
MAARGGCAPFLRALGVSQILVCVVDPRALTQVKWQDHCDRARGYAINLAWCSLDFLKVCSNKHCVARERGTGRPCTVLNLRECPSVEAVDAAQQARSASTSTRRILFCPCTHMDM